MYDVLGDKKKVCTNCGSNKLALNSTTINGGKVENVYRCIECGKQNIIRSDE